MNEDQNFLRYPFAQTESIEKFWTKRIVKIPQTEYRSVFEMIEIPRNGCKDIIPNAKIPNAKITNAIIPNVTCNGSPN